MNPIHLLIVDDHAMVREGLKVLLEPLEYVAIVGVAATGAEALAAARQLRPDVVLLDINLPDMSGIDVCQTLTAEQPGLKILALTTFNERLYVTRMMQAGAAGYVLKNALPEELAEAITRVFAGKKFFSEEVQNLLLQAPAEEAAAPLLTRREKEVLAAIADGHTSQHVADALHVSLLTIETHRRNLLTKFGVNNTALLIRQAAQLGLI